MKMLVNQSNKLLKMLLNYNWRSLFNHMKLYQSLISTNTYKKNSLRDRKKKKWKLNKLTGQVKYHLYQNLWINSSFQKLMTILSVKHKVSLTMAKSTKILSLRNFRCSQRKMSLTSLILLVLTILIVIYYYRISQTLNKSIALWEINKTVTLCQRSMILNWIKMQTRLLHKCQMRADSPLK